MEFPDRQENRLQITLSHQHGRLFLIKNRRDEEKDNNINNNNIFPPKIEGLHLKMWTHICNVRFLNHCCNIAAIFPMFV